MELWMRSSGKVASPRGMSMPNPSGDTRDRSQHSTLGAPFGLNFLDAYGLPPLSCKETALKAKPTQEQSAQKTKDEPKGPRKLEEQIQLPPKQQAIDKTHKTEDRTKEQAKTVATKIPEKKSDDSWFSRMVQNIEDDATQLEHAVAKEATAVNNFVGNVEDVGLAIAKGTIKCAKDTYFSVEHGIENGAEWVYHHPGTAAAIVGGAIVAVGVEVATGGLATPLLAAAATTAMPIVEGAGLLYTAVKVGTTIDNVAKHGELGIIMHQQELNTTAAGRAKVAQAKEQLGKDTGGTTLMLVTTAAGAAITKLPIFSRSAAASTEAATGAVGKEATATATTIGTVAATKKAVGHLITTGKTVKKATHYATSDWLGDGVSDGQTGNKVLQLHH
jgi:hypothetical protein